MKALTEAEKKMLNELREKAQTILDYMQRNKMMGFNRVSLDIVPDYRGEPFIDVTATTVKGNENRSASISQLQYSDMEWTTNISEWRNDDE